MDPGILGGHLVPSLEFKTFLGDSGYSVGYAAESGEISVSETFTAQNVINVNIILFLYMFILKYKNWLKPVHIFTPYT